MVSLHLRKRQIDRWDNGAPRSAAVEDVLIGVIRSTAAKTANINFKKKL